MRCRAPIRRAFAVTCFEAASNCRLPWAWITSIYRPTLHRCVIDGPATQNRDGIADWRGHPVGRVSWAAQVNAGKAARLAALLARIDWAR